jgi:hypothetical protein
MVIRNGVIILALITVLLSSSVMAADQVQVSLYVLNLGKFDITTGSFTADFYLSMKCPKSCSVGEFEFMNGRATTTDKIVDKPNEKFYRLQATLNSPIDLRKFPFDRQKMQIILEDKEKTVDDLVYSVSLEESGVDPSVTFPGWKFIGWNSTVSEHYYGVYDETYSQYAFTIDISRIFLNSLIKTFLPVFFIVLVVLSSFLLDPDKITTRIGMVGSALVASVMFHISIANQIPPTGYLTFADKFMVCTYFILLMSFVLNVVLLELHEQKKTELVEKLHRSTEYAMFIIVPLVYVILFLVLM